MLMISVVCRFIRYYEYVYVCSTGQATIPAEFLISFFLFGIEEVGIQIEVQ